MATQKKPARGNRWRVGTLMRALFAIRLAHPDGIQAREALVSLEQQVPPTDDDRHAFPSVGRRYEKIVRFATVDLVKAGWMRKDRRMWAATEAGAVAFGEMPDPAVFYRRACERYQARRAAQPDQAVEDAVEPEPDVRGGRRGRVGGDPGLPATDGSVRFADAGRGTAEGDGVSRLLDRPTG